MKESYLVTGCSGYIGSWITRYLLEQGHKVYGSVRSLARPEKYSHIKKLADTEEGELHLVEGDLLDKEAFEEVAKKVDIVIHTASPFSLQVKDPQRDLVDPALQGTINVLSAAKRSDRVRRVVLTSSVVALYGDAQEIYETENKQFGPSHWNQTSNLTHQPYSYSKTLAERKAWDIASKVDHWELVTIHPSFVMGPTISGRKDSTSVDFLLQLLEGRFSAGAPPIHFGFVDVRDVALLHIKAAQDEKAHGRYIASHFEGSLLDFASKIEKVCPKRFSLPRRTLPKFMIYLFGPFMGLSWKFIRRNMGHPISFDRTKTDQQFSHSFISPEKMLRDAIHQMEADGWLKN